MEESAIEQLCNNWSNLEAISRILQNFLLNNEKSAFAFPSLIENNQRVILWTALFQLLQKKECQPVHGMCLAAIRILSRDKTDLENLLCERWIKVLIDKAGLYNFSELDEEAMVSIALHEKDITVEALKCLCNITYNSEVARIFCADTDIAQSLVARMRIYKYIPYKDEIMLFDMKLLFILTALRYDIRVKVKELHGMDYLMSCLNEIIHEASSCSENASASPEEYFLQDEKYAITSDILKAQFNLILMSGPKEALSEYEEAMFLKLMPILTTLLYFRSSTEEKMFNLHNNINNLLTSVPTSFYTFLTPLLSEGESARYVYDGRNMDALQSLVNLLHYKLTMFTQNIPNQHENLSPILSVMNKCSRSCRSQRKYLRQVVLPPLRDVSHPPEKGNTLRNQLCRLLTTPVTVVRDLVAEFLFILCKEKVGRMVKYTGFGNAAGHLAQKGLLSSVRSAQYSSSSDDSDTEEYLEAQPNIDPVVGCTRPPRINPFEGMTEEEKEFEAMKLVDLFESMVTQGVVRPARIGPDGRPQPIEHVLELRDDQPKRQS